MVNGNSLLTNITFVIEHDRWALPSRLIAQASLRRMRDALQATERRELHRLH